MEKNLKILFTGGGTGGHLFPIIAIAREMRRIYNQNKLNFYYIGPPDEFGSIFLRQENFEVKNIITGKIRRYFSWENVSDILFKIPLGFFQSFYFLLRIRPQLVFCKGGTGAAPVVVAAKILGIPIFLHESDVVPGLSNQFASRYAKKIFTAFPKTEYFDLSKAIVVGNPIKKELMDGDKKIAKEIFHLTFEKPIILFIGGSQGAEAINDFVLRILNRLLKDYEIIHVCGLSNLKEIQAEAQIIEEKPLEKYYHVYGFLDEEKLKHAYKAADLIVSRAGSGIVYEIAAAGKPSILIPLPGSSFNHQLKNAFDYAETGAAIVMEQGNLEPEFFTAKVNYLFLKPEEMKKMSEAAIKFSKPFAAKTVAREILEYLNPNAN